MPRNKKLVNDIKEIKADMGTHVQSTVIKRPKGNPNWKKGVSGFPQGRPKGARCQFGESFVTEFANHWAVNGNACLDKLADKYPEAYSRVAIALLPKVIEFGDETRTAITEALTKRLPFESIREKIEKENAIDVQVH